MSQAAVEKALGKLITDECFRGRFFKDPAAAGFFAGLELSQAELDALSRLPVKAIAKISGCCLEATTVPRSRIPRKLRELIWRGHP